MNWKKSRRRDATGQKNTKVVNWRPLEPRARIIYYLRIGRTIDKGCDGTGNGEVALLVARHRCMCI